jgi:hypothetical protein
MAGVGDWDFETAGVTVHSVLRGPQATNNRTWSLPGLRGLASAFSASYFSIPRGKVSSLRGLSPNLMGIQDIGQEEKL